MRKSTPFSKIKKLLLPKKAPPGPPKATSPGNRALDEALHRHLPFDDLSEEYTFQAGFGEGFNAGLRYATSLLESITKQ